MEELRRLPLDCVADELKNPAEDQPLFFQLVIDDADVRLRLVRVGRVILEL